MDLKILDKDNKEKNITVLDEVSLNSSAILNLDEDLNNTTKIEIVIKAIAIVEDNNYIEKLTTKVNKSAKRNTLIENEYNSIKDEVFKSFNQNKTFDEINQLIDNELMKLEIKGETKKVYNSFDFWYTHKDQKLKSLISNYNRLVNYKKLYDEVG